MVYSVAAIISNGARTAGTDMVRDVVINKVRVVLATEVLIGLGLTRATLGERLTGEVNGAFSL